MKATSLVFDRHVRARVASRTSRPPSSRHGPAATRATTLGSHPARRRSVRFDRVLATRLGMSAIGAVVEGHWGTMVALKGTDIEHAALQEALGSSQPSPKSHTRKRRSSSAKTEAVDLGSDELEILLQLFPDDPVGGGTFRDEPMSALRRE